MEDLTLIIPAKKEKESLPKVLEELKKFNFNIKICLDKNDIETIDSQIEKEKADGEYEDEGDEDNM